MGKKKYNLIREQKREGTISSEPVWLEEIEDCPASECDGEECEPEEEFCCNSCMRGDACEKSKPNESLEEKFDKVWDCLRYQRKDEWNSTKQLAQIAKEHIIDEVLRVLDLCPDLNDVNGRFLEEEYLRKAIEKLGEKK